MTYVLTGATSVSDKYVDENGVERRYRITRGQSVASLNLPSHVEKELVNRKTASVGGSRIAPIPYFTKVDDGGRPAEPSPAAAEGIITMARLSEGVQQSRINAGIVEPSDEFTKSIPVPPEEPEVPLGVGVTEAPATTPDEAEAAVTEEPQAEPVVSPDASDNAACANPDCAVDGDTNNCVAEDCPVNEAPVANDDPPADAANEAPAEAVAEVVPTANPDEVVVAPEPSTTHFEDGTTPPTPADGVVTEEVKEEAKAEKPKPAGAKKSGNKGGAKKK